MLATIGLVLAVIDFTGLTDWVERGLDWARVRLQSLLLRFYRSVEAWFDRDVALGAKGKTLLFLKLSAAALYLYGLVLFGGFLRDYVPLIPDAFRTGYEAMAVLAILVAFAAAMAFPGAVVAFWLAASLLWGMFHVLNMPPRGTVGSIGLILALVEYFWK